MMPAGVGPVAAVEEGVAGGGDDLVRVLRVLRRRCWRRWRRTWSARSGPVADLAPSGEEAIWVGEAGGVAGGQQGAEDRLHDRPAEVALEVGGARGHPGPGHRHRAGQRARGGGAGEADADTDQQVAEADLQ